MRLGDHCFGCSACESICPVKAIELKENDDLFLSPRINYNLCIHCNKCMMICPAITRSNTQSARSFYAGFHTDKYVVMRSASGGAAYALAEYFLKRSGIVFGASWGDDCSGVEHIGINNNKDLALLQGSKYIQSKKKCFSDVRHKLFAGKNVLFFGTPCEIAGLKKYLQKEFSNLFTADLICQGNTSPQMYIQYKQFLENNFGARIVHVDCRFQKNVHKDSEYYILKVIFDTGDYYLAPFFETPWGIAFSRYKRKECYSCPFKGESSADWTLGDAWGIDAKYPFYNKAGTSVIICNTERGEKLVDKLNDFSLWKVSSEIMLGNKRWKTPLEKSQSDILFEKTLKKNNMSLIETIDEMYRESIKTKIFRYIPWSFKKKVFHAGKNIISEIINYEKVQR